MSITSERLLETRKEKGLTQKQLSELTGISEVMISQYERDIRSPKLSQLQKFADALNVTANYLSGMNEDKIERTYIDKDGNECSEISWSYSTTIDAIMENIETRKALHSYLKKFDKLDDYGKDLVITVLEKEYDRCIHEEKDPNE